MKTENWDGHEIRFVEYNGEWWAVLKDVCDALALSAKGVKQRLEKGVISNYPLSTAGGVQEMLIVNEFGIYQTIFQSRKQEAKDFQRWTYTMLKELRQQSGLEGFEIFRMMDKQHQRNMMATLSQSIKTVRPPKREDFIKANQIANKAVSNKYGFPKLVSKQEMTPQMLVDREPVLEDTVSLMSLKERYGMDISVSKTIYGAS